MNNEVKYLRAATDRKSGDLVVYFLGSSGEINKFVPSPAIKMHRSRRDEIIETERYLDGDRYILLLPDSTLYASEENTRFYHEQMGAKRAKKMKAMLLEDLPKEAKRLELLIERLEHTERAFEAGVLSSDGKEFTACWVNTTMIDG